MTIKMIKANKGFSLMEMAIVLLIVGLLLGGLLPTVGSQIEVQRMKDTRKQLDEIQQALFGYAITNSRLPCPASSASNGAESFADGGSATNGNCSNFNNGFIPAVTLGLSPVDSQGYAIDAWNNRIRYAVSSALSNALTKSNGMSLTTTPNLFVCSTASTTVGCSVANSTLASNAVSVIYSTGKNGGYGGTGADETENPNPNSADNDSVFVSHTLAPIGAENGEFDDMVVWISPNILFNRMVTAGKLP